MSALENVDNGREIIWTGSAGYGSTITLLKNAFDYRFLVFQNETDAIYAVQANISRDRAFIRAGGLVVTENENIGTFGVRGTITNDGMGMKLEDCGYVTHTKSSDHSGITYRSINYIYGFK